MKQFLLGFCIAVVLLAACSTTNTSTAHAQSSVSNDIFAFPRRNDGNGFAGMTLRDYFAGQLISGYNAQYPEYDAKYAANAYRMADAMLSAR